ncbi:hypothetical protein F4825DRAFT_456540 [Nemania diffusa]|nr:hypothetical protein F4825DRAFT_456540 [Nemania diffusa]
MEGLAALSVAANIFQFLEYSLQLVGKAKNLRELGAIDPDLDTDAQRLRDIANTLIPQRLPLHAGDIGQLAGECVRVSEDLISELAQLKPSDPKSKWHGFKALIKNELKKSRFQDLEGRLQIYRSQLSLHLILISRDETNKKLDDIAGDGQLVQSQLAVLNSMAKSLNDSKHVGEDILSTLQTLIQNYNKSLVQRRQQTILDMLRFPGIHERFDTVAYAHEETFQWLLAKTTDSDEESVPLGQDRLPWVWRFDDERVAKEKTREAFITWLRMGSGFFHVSGKPGAGKSTLMKYICRHPELRRHLNDWCQGSRLCLGQFFFWRPGNAGQKSLKGLLCGLVYSILYENQDLIPTAFPEVWDLLLTQPGLSSALEYRDFQQGLENLLVHAAQTRSDKFALFIDGLDEFDGRHLDLIRTMETWTKEYPTLLKICVSSREYIVFQEAFKLYPRLRLHELTFVDIRRMVTARLQSNDDYKALFSSGSSLAEDYYYPSAIINLVTNRAEGVFLWVSLVLATIEDGLMSGDNLEELKDKIEAYPTELGPLYRHLVRSIHASDRNWAFRALKLVQFLQFNDKEKGLFSTRFGSITTDRQTIHLLQLSFLDDLRWEYDVFEKITTQELVSEELRKRVQNTYKKVYGRCKGFLEIKPCETANPLAASGAVIFTHRSLIEFLETPEMVEMMLPYISDFNCFESACHTLLSCFKYLHPAAGVFSGSLAMKITGPHTLIGILSPQLLETVKMYITMAIRQRCSDSENFMLFLDFMGRIFTDHLKRIERDTSQLLDPSDYVALKSLSYGNFEYWKWRRCRYPTRPIPQLYQGYLVSLFHECYREGIDWTQDRFIEVTNSLVSLGLDLNSKADEGRFHLDKHSLGSTPWQGLLWDLLDMRLPRTWCPGALIDWFLRHGADPTLTMGRISPNGPYWIPWRPQDEGWQLFRPFSQARISFSSLLSGCGLQRPDVVVLIKDTSLLCQMIKGQADPITLLDLLTRWFPKNANYFQDLIEKLQSAKTVKYSDLENLPAPKKFEQFEYSWIERGSRIIYDETDIKWELQATGTTSKELDEQVGGNKQVVERRRSELSSSQ